MIRRYGDPVLRRTATSIDATAAETRALLDAMWEELDVGGGVGLAAAQIGVVARALIVRVPADRGKTKGQGSERRLELINPVVDEVFGERRSFEEGCLSFPGLYFRVWRRRGIAVTYETTAGETVSLRDDGLVARIVQHELDHLDGVLFIDRLPAWRRLAMLPRLQWLRWRGRRADGGGER